MNRYSYHYEHCICENCSAKRREAWRLGDRPEWTQVQSAAALCLFIAAGCAVLLICAYVRSHP